MAENQRVGPALSLADARQLTLRTLERGRELRLPPLTVAVLDPGGHLITLDRDDGAAILRPKMAIGKAFAALSIGMSSRAISELAQSRAPFVAALSEMSEAFTPSAGGLLIEDRAHHLFGAIGVTGAAPDEDEICALHALDAQGFVTPSKLESR